MANILRCRDRWHRVIVLPADNWHDKILLDHTEMIGNEASVLLALTDPDIVTYDKDYADPEVFYRRGALPSPDDADYLKVCVAFRSSPLRRWHGRVVTAYATGMIKRGEKHKWKRST